MDHIVSQITGAHILLICIWILSTLIAWRLKSESPLAGAVVITIFYGLFKWLVVK